MRFLPHAAGTIKGWPVEGSSAAHFAGGAPSLNARSTVPNVTPDYPSPYGHYSRRSGIVHLQLWSRFNERPRS